MTYSEHELEFTFAKNYNAHIFGTKRDINRQKKISETAKDPCILPMTLRPPIP